MSNLLTPGYDFLSNAIKSSVEKAKKDIQLFFNDLKKRPLTLPIEIFVTGAAELGENFWTALLGKTPTELGVEAALKGNTVGEQFCIAFYNSFENRSESVIEAIFGSTEDLGKRAAEAGNTVGVQFAAEVGKGLAEFINSNPVFKELYKIGTGKDIEKQLEVFTKVANGQRLATSAGGGSHTSGTRTGSSHPEQSVILKPSLGNTAADEARKLGEAYAKAYAEGLKSQSGEVQSAGTTLYKSGKNGADNNGNAVGGYKYVAQNQAYAFTNNLASTKTKASAYNAGQSIASQASAGSKTYTGGFKTAGEQSGAGYVAGVNNKTNLQKAKEAGATIASNALKKLKEVLGIHSPSRAFGEAGMYSVEGYAQYMEKYSYLAENAARDMARDSLKAVETANAYTRSNAGYGIGASNQSAMADFMSNMYNAFASAMTGIDTKGDTIVMIDGKEVFRVVQKQARENGVAIGNGAFT